MYLVHWPQNWEHVEAQNAGFARNEDGSLRYTNVPLEETWKAMEACVDANLTRNIGLSNFNEAQIKAIMASCKIRPSMLQVEIHPFFSQNQLVEFAHSNQLAITAYSPLGSGAEIRGTKVVDHPKLKEIATRLGKSPAQVVTAWLLQRGVIVIPKSVKEERIKQNLDVYGIALTDEDVSAINALNANCRSGWGGPLVTDADGNDRPRDLEHPNYPFTFPAAAVEAAEPAAAEGEEAASNPTTP